MKYDFETVIDRRAADSYKWDIPQGELPMWVADMDLYTAPAVREAIVKRAEHGVFGYTVVPERWYSAISGWWKARHEFEIQKDWLCFCTGVIPAISSMVKRLTNVGDNVLLQTPVFDIFFHSVENAGRHVLENRLAYEDGEYSIDFDDLEKKLAHPLTTLMILCNPHNPVGMIFSDPELERIGELCKKHGVTVISDEIHCDLTDPDFAYTPYASVSDTCRDNCVVCVSASKAFNIAGLQSAAVYVPNKSLRDKVVRGLNSDEVAEPNCFAVDSTVAAFTRGGEWLDALRTHLAANKAAVYKFVGERLKMLKVVPQHVTYLLWIDCSEITDDATKLRDFIRKTTGLYLSAGEDYRGNGKTFLRMNVACPRAYIRDGLDRLENGVKAFINKA